MNRKVIHSVFEDVVTKYENKIAINSSTGSVNYKDLNDFANRISHLLSSIGCGPGTIVNVALPSSIQLVGAMLGVFKNGAIFLPVDLSFSEKRLKQIFTEAFDGVIISAPETLDQLLEIASRFSLSVRNIIILSPDGTIELMETKGAKLENFVFVEGEDWTANPALSVDGESSSYIYYTSGSTGEGKAILGKHVSLSHFIHWEIKEFGVNENFCVSQLTQVTFDASLRDIFVPLIAGGTLCIPPTDARSNPKLLLDWFEKSKITLVHCVPSLFRILTKELQMEGKLYSDLNHLNYILMAGEILYAKDILNWQAIAGNRIQLVNLYGATETTLIKSFYRILHFPQNPSSVIPVGVPISNTVIAILTEGRICNPNEIGEIYIKTPFASKGYYKNQELTNECFVQNPLVQDAEDIVYRTGDYGRYLDDGNIEVLGRMDNQVKINGVRVELLEVEQAILGLPEVEGVVVKSHRNDDNMLTLVAYYIGAEKSPDYFSAALVEKLNQYMIPNYFIYMTEFPLTINGKIDKKALPLPEEALRQFGEFVAPVGDLENLLATFWMEILGLSKIGRNISFFSVGGHSLRAIQLVSKIYKETGINLKISDIFTQKTIKDLALFISGQSKSEFRSIKPAAEKELYKLSAAQKRLYFLYEFDPLSIAYNISDVFYLGDNTDADKIELTLNKLVERHESLRTIFLKIGDEVFQKILPTLTIKLERSECNEADFANYLSEFARPFDLEHGPLLRSALVNLRNGKFAWLIDIHHIIADGTSYQTLMSDFSKLYAGEELEKPKLQYRDFSEWQNKLILSGDLDAQRAYWITQFEEKVPRLNLASDFQRPENFTFQGSSIELQFDKSTIDLLRVFTIKSGATLQTTLLAVLNVLFFKYTGQEDVAIGCGIAGRRHADVERIVGMFVNTLAIRSYPTGEMSFSSFIEQVTSNSILAYENQDVQFEDMVDVLKLERDPSRNPLFDICLVVQNFERLSFDRSVLTNSEGQRPETTRGIDLVNTTSKFDMTWFFYESNDSLLLHLEYYSAIFKQSTIERFAKQFNSILATVLNAPELTLSKINFLTQDEEKHVLENIVLGPKCHYEENLLHGSFEKACEMFPNAMAIVDEQGSFTFSELNTRANRLARFLKDGIGIKSEAPIGVLQKRGHNAIVSILAILKAGGTYVAIDYDYPEERILHILKEAQIEIILTQKSALGRTNRLAWRTSCTNHVVCVDSENAHVELDDHKNELMRKDLWDHVGETARDLISGGGWQNSFTGQYFSEAEMNEYAENTYSKLKPYLHKNMKVLEIGCASGITLLAIAPHVHQYVGIDLSSSIIANTEAMVKGMGYENVSFKCLPADEVNTLDGGYDLVIINSVIQCFNSHNYLRDVLSKAISKMKPTGFLFLGDLMDEDKREDLLTELNEFSQSTQKKHATKTDLSAELFISRKFLDDLISDNIGIIKAEYSDKIGTIQNELTRFRFDALLSVSKHDTVKQKLPRNKHQHDLQRISSYESTPLDLTIDGENLAYILFTSGTSGQPKGVLVKHCGVSNTILSYLDFLNIQHGEKVLQFASLSFDASIWEMFLSLSSGSTLYIPTDDQRQSPEELLDYVNHYGITFATLTPSYLKQMEISKLKTLKSLVSVGEQASYSTLAEFSLHGNAFNAYGPTESSICATAFQFVDEGESQKNIPIGNPATNGSVYILNEMNKLVSTGVVGEICIGGRGVARGYLNNKNLTEAKFIDNPYLKGETIYKTGDLGRWLPNGTIEFIGRKDDQVKIRGHRIELREIENVILKYGSINDTVVITLAAQGESSIVAYYVSDHEITATSLRSFMRTHLPTYMMPEHFVRIESLPISTNGKVNKRALPKPAGTQLSRDDRYVEARNEYESRLVKIWEAVLNTQRVGVLDDFFESGGHSLKATRLSSQIHKEFNVKVSIKELFANTTIEAQANTIQRIIWLNSEVKMENEMVI